MEQYKFKLEQSIQKNIENRLKYYLFFKIVGSYHRGNHNNNSDIDLLVIPKKEKSFKKKITLLTNIINDFKSFVGVKLGVVSDSYFIPFINKITPDIILHIIFFYSVESFRLSPLSTFFSPDISLFKINYPKRERLSIILAIQDIIKLTLLKNFNCLSLKDSEYIKSWINRLFENWIIKNKNYCTQYENDILEVIQNGSKENII